MDSLERIIEVGELTSNVAFKFEEGMEDRGRAAFIALDRADRVVVVLTLIEILSFPDDAAFPHALAHRVLRAIVPLI